MGKTIDMTGQKFGRLTVIKRTDNRSNEVCWLCKCECGNIKSIMARSLKNGDATSCGCYNRERVKEVNLIDLTGQKFGRLTVIKQVPNKGKETCWLCKCECGKEKIILGNTLRQKTTVSCGCYIKEIVSKGGISPISNYLRSLNVQWFNECKKQAHYTCQLTGKTGSSLNTHHLKSFNTIVKEAHDLYNIAIKEVVAEYTEEELKLLEEYVGSWHKDNSNGIVLSEDVHKLFHSLYGKGENTPEQYIEFKERYLAGEFKEILK